MFTGAHLEKAQISKADTDRPATSSKALALIAELLCLELRDCASTCGRGARGTRSYGWSVAFVMLTLNRTDPLGVRRLSLGCAVVARSCASLSCIATACIDGGLARLEWRDEPCPRRGSSDVGKKEEASFYFASRVDENDHRTRQ